MGHKAFISFKSEDISYKEEIQSWIHLDYVDKSLNKSIDSEDFDYIMNRIRNEYLRDSTVTISLIGAYSAEDRGPWEQRYIKRELQASLYHRTGNTKNGVLGVVLPGMENTIYAGTYACSQCGHTHNSVQINNSTVVREFSYNYYIPDGDKCGWAEEDRYCVLTRWDDFKSAPNTWINLAYDKRLAPIASKTKVRPS